jgi:hypothetical protein
MKYIKLYENSTYPHSAKIDDIVKCITLPYHSFFEIGEKYKIIKINKQDYNTYWFDILRLKDNKIETGWNSELFLPELEYNMKKYNI